MVHQQCSFYVLGFSSEKLLGMCQTDKFSNIHATYSYFFSKYKTETANRGQRQLLFLTSGFHPNANNTQLADDMLEILIVNGFD